MLISTYRLMKVALSIILWVPVGCGGADIGEPCEEVGSGAECVAMAICTNDDGDTAFCRQVCEEHEDCPMGESCNGVSGTSLKSCQPDN